MIVTDEDLKLSNEYQKAIKEANYISFKSIKKYKDKLSNKQEISIFLSNKDLLNNMTKDLSYLKKHTFLLKFLLSHLTNRKMYTKFLLMTKGYYTFIHLFIIFLFMFIFIISIYLY